MPVVARPLAERFWARVDKSGGPEACWPFTGRGRCGKRRAYGKIQTGGRGSPSVSTHRLAYALAVCPLQEAVDVHHMCDGGGLCCNPAHLAPYPTRSTGP